LLNTLKYSVWVSRGAGLVLIMDGFLIMLAVCRNLIRFLRPKIRFLPLDENLWFHRQTAYMLLLFAIIHTTAHYVNFFVFCFNDKVNCRTLRRCARDLLQPYKFTMLRLVVSRVMLCSCVCYLCTLLPMHQSASKHSRLSGIHTTSLSFSFSHSIHMLPDALYVTQPILTVRSRASCFGSIASDMKDGD
jgi:Ferric reductase like transmembrane component